jgi:hypothetical protein
MLGAYPTTDFLEISFDFNRTNISRYDGIILADQFRDHLQ